MYLGFTHLINDLFYEYWLLRGGKRDQSRYKIFCLSIFWFICQSITDIYFVGQICYWFDKSWSFIMRSRLQSFFKLILFISIILIILGVSAKWIVGPIVIPTIVYKNMELTNGTLGYDTWVCNAQYKYINIKGVLLRNFRNYVK